MGRLEKTPGVDRDTACDRNRVCAPTPRSRHSPRVTPRGFPLSRAALGWWDHAPRCPRDRHALPPRPALSNIHLPFPRAQPCSRAVLSASAPSTLTVVALTVVEREDGARGRQQRRHVRPNFFFAAVAVV